MYMKNSSGPSKDELIVTSVCFAFFLSLAFLFPYTGDDWAWGSSIGIRRLANSFHNYNGRYFGNIIVLILTRHRVFRAFVMAGSYSLSCWMCYRYIEEKNIRNYLFSVILFLGMPKEMFREAIAWTSGFANYVPSAMISLSFILTGSRLSDDAIPNDTNASSVRMFFLAFCGALFMEHITVFHIVLSLFFILFTKKQHGIILFSHVWMLIGSLLGAICMFSNSIYWNVLQGNKAYQKTAGSLLELFFLIGSNGLRCLKSLIIDNSLMCSVAAVLLAVLCYQYTRDHNDPKTNTSAVYTTVTLCVCQAMILLLDFSTATWVLVVQGILSIAYVISCMRVLHICIPQKHRNRIGFPLWCVIAVSLPLLFVSPVGPRCCFVSYLFLITFLTNLLNYLLKHWNLHVIGHRTFPAVLCAFATIQMITLGTLFHTIFVYEQRRIEFAEAQSENNTATILICSLPYEDYLHCSSPDAEPLITRYKLFYNLDSNISLKIVTPEQLDAAIVHFRKNTNSAEP